MMTRWLVGVVAAVVMAAAFTRGGEARAEDGDATELWLVDVMSGQTVFIGSMASQRICEMSASALARDRHAQGTGRTLAVFDCRPLAIEVH